MSDILDTAYPDPEDFTVCWLQPVIRAATARDPGDGFPFALVEFIVGTDCPDEGVFDGVVQVDYLDTERDGLTAVQAASVTSQVGHRRMQLLGQQISDVPMSDGSTANCDYLTTLESPHRMDYPNERVVRYTARYRLGLQFVAADTAS